MVASLLLVMALASCAPVADVAPPPEGGSLPALGSSPTGGESPSGAASSAAGTGEKPAPTRWQPTPGTSWQWQLSGALELGVEADIFDLDYETTAGTDIAKLKSEGRRTVCYLSVGSWESFRGDADQFPDVVQGSVMSGWPDERWLDVRRLDVLLPIMAARMDTCVAKGFDAVEPDNVDGYLNESGFALTAADQLAFNRAVAALAHARGLSVALKNDLDQIPHLVDDFDFAVNEECFRYEECDAYVPFAEVGKAVLHVEYEGSLNFCAESKDLGFSSLLKPLELGAARQPC